MALESRRGAESLQQAAPEACEAGRTFDSRSGEFEERKRDWAAAA